MEKLAERALKAAVPTMWLTRGREALAIVKFPHKTEPGEWWAERLWIATTWIAGRVFRINITLSGMIPLSNGSATICGQMVTMKYSPSKSTSKAKTPYCVAWGAMYHGRPA
jgi:hypothetical protein